MWMHVYVGKFTLLFGWWVVVRNEAGCVILVGTGAQSQTATGLDSIVHGAVVVCVKELLEPLQELKVVLEAALY